MTCILSLVDADLCAFIAKFLGKKDIENFIRASKRFKLTPKQLLELMLERKFESEEVAKMHRNVLCMPPEVFKMEHGFDVHQVKPFKGDHLVLGLLEHSTVEVRYLKKHPEKLLSIPFHQYNPEGRGATSILFGFCSEDDFQVIMYFRDTARIVVHSWLLGKLALIDWPDDTDICSVNMETGESNFLVVKFNSDPERPRYGQNIHAHIFNCTEGGRDWHWVSVRSQDPKSLFQRLTNIKRFVKVGDQVLIVKEGGVWLWNAAVLSTNQDRAGDYSNWREIKSKHFAWPKFQNARLLGPGLLCIDEELEANIARNMCSYVIYDLDHDTVGPSFETTPYATFTGIRDSPHMMRHITYNYCRLYTIMRDGLTLVPVAEYPFKALEMDPRLTANENVRFIITPNPLLPNMGKYCIFAIMRGVEDTYHIFRFGNCPGSFIQKVEGECAHV